RRELLSRRKDRTCISVPAPNRGAERQLDDSSVEALERVASLTRSLVTGRFWLRRFTAIRGGGCRNAARIGRRGFSFFSPLLTLRDRENKNERMWPAGLMRPVRAVPVQLRLATGLTSEEYR